MAYSQVERHLWHDETFRGLSPDARLAFLYLLTCPHMNRLGMFVLDRFYAAADLQLDPARVEAALADLVAADRISYDPGARLVLIRRFLKHNPLKNPNVVTAACADLTALPYSQQLWEQLRAAVKRYGRSFYKQLYEQLTKQLGDKTANQEPEQEQEPDPEQEPEPDQPDAALPAKLSHTREARPATAAAGGGELDERTERILSDDPVARAAQLEMLEDLRLQASAIADPVERSSFEAEGRALISKDNPSYWRNPKTGGSIPWEGTEDVPGRRQLFAMALLHWEARSASGERQRLQSSLRYVIPEHLDPHQAPRSNRASPGSPAAAVTATRSDDAGRASLERDRDAAVAEDQLRIQRWRKDHTDEAARIDSEAEAAFPEVGEGDDVAAVTRRVQVKAEINRRIAALIDQRGAA